MNMNQFVLPLFGFPLFSSSHINKKGPSVIDLVTYSDTETSLGVHRYNEYKNCDIIFVHSHDNVLSSFNVSLPHAGRSAVWYAIQSLTGENRAEYYCTSAGTIQQILKHSIKDIMVHKTDN